MEPALERRGRLTNISCNAIFYVLSVQISHVTRNLPAFSLLFVSPINPEYAQPAFLFNSRRAFRLALLIHLVLNNFI